MLGLESQLVVGAYSLVAWFLLYLLIAQVLKVWARTKNLPYCHRAALSESFISGVQGAACGIIGVITVYSCWHDVMGATFPIAVSYSSIGVAYFMYDLWAMYTTHVAHLKGQHSFARRITSYIQKQSLMIGHHVVLVTLLFPALVYRSQMGHFFIGCFYCSELSTPFVNGRVIISKLGFKSSRVYIINGLLMMVMFAMCRVAMFPLMYCVYLSQQTKAPSHIQALLNIPAQCHACCALVLAPQVYWLTLMIKGALSLVFKTDSVKID
ncbi:TLC domain-containing protein 3A [Oratosquilla oratoria]|uniref:TLC domain-containing protein 3A n=1 Tax=Oratosquilla oratoria TaxID=337810 RepID=UPI003F760562